MIPDIIGSLYDKKAEYLASVSITASRINSRNSSIFWESERNIDFVSGWLTRLREVENDGSKELTAWIDRFRKDKNEAALEFWFEISKGVHESLREF